jgi:hypothetical protein
VSGSPVATKCAPRYCAKCLLSSDARAPAENTTATVGLNLPAALPALATLLDM